jgi:hypothetical protein
MNFTYSFFVPAILFFCLFASAGIADAQGGSGKTTTTTTSTKTKAKTSVKTTKTVKTKSKKTPDPPVGDWEMTNLYGHWEGVYNEIKSDLEIERVEGDNFYGYFTTKEGFKIAFTGVVDRAARKVTMTETEILAKPADGSWRLGVNTGTLKYGGFDMKGTGTDGNTVYTWSYIQILL